MRPSDAEAPGRPDYAFDFSFNKERQDDIIGRLNEWNRSHTPNHEANSDGRFAEEQIQLYALDPEGNLVGGLIGRTHDPREWLGVAILFVDESCRGRGLGRELMKRAEDEAYRRGCRYAQMATGSHQAPGFYEKLGYTRYGTLEDLPPGVTFYFYTKRLAEPAGSER